jgi:tRNA nucleotidyltransferase (CCA-adding enzyme)
MEIYLVGGAVRDQLLGLPVQEKDWVVVGATAADMLKKGYRQVGKDFPVYLHPETHEEYALARVERKTGSGYTGFDFDASPTVTLEEDLLRRDLTINAIAQTVDGKNYIDPYHGRTDIDKKILRHVSPAFTEDPVRILRVARFAARFASLGFQVAPETLSFMQAMIASGEVNALVAERVWKELERALQEKNPEEFFKVLEACGGLSILFPDIQTAQVERLQKAAKFLSDSEIRFAILLFDLSPEAVKNLCERYRVPSAYKELAQLVARDGKTVLRAEKLSAAELLNLFQSTDAFRREDRFKKFLQAIAGTAVPARQLDWLLQLQEALKKIDYSSDPSLAGKGKEIGDHIAKKRIAIIENFIQAKQRE